MAINIVSETHYLSFVYFHKYLFTKLRTLGLEPSVLCQALLSYCDQN